MTFAEHFAQCGIIMFCTRCSQIFLRAHNNLSYSKFRNPTIASAEVVQNIFGVRKFASNAFVASTTTLKKKAGRAPEIETLNEKVQKYKMEKKTIEFQKGNPSEYTGRTHTCGELTAENVGDTVTLCGWLTYKRLNGAFIVLRDLYGVTQVHVPRELSEEVVKTNQAPLETVLQITGQVALRPEKQIRPDQVSGEVEVIAKNVTILNQPKEIRLAFNDFDKIDEELRLRYRYLHLRNAQAQHFLRVRSLFLSKVRRFMEANHFIEIETPTLIRRTPGGAREFPVLTKFTDSFYALAQSPQILKQLLMAAGMDRYYQIARCYRDEGGKPDRQPEFTQLDIELSFTSRENVMKLVENLMKYVCPSETIPNSGEPFPVITYKECMNKYGTDKPDIGGFLWVVDFPLFLRNEQSGKLEAAHHPFTMPANVEKLCNNPEEVLGLSYDLIYCGAEVGGGSIRIHDAKLQRLVFESILELPAKDINYLLEALESGCPPHGGFALGIDRFLSKMLNTHSIRDVIAFPKSGDGKDLMSGAPNHLEKDAKIYYGIK